MRVHCVNPLNQELGMFGFYWGHWVGFGWVEQKKNAAFSSSEATDFLMLSSQSVVFILSVKKEVFAVHPTHKTMLLFIESNGVWKSNLFFLIIFSFHEESDAAVWIHLFFFFFFFIFFW